MKRLLRYLYNKHREFFWDLIIEDFYGEIPSKIKAPGVEFLSNARESLEPFWSIQAYNITRRSISDSKNTQIYHGFLLCIRTLLAITSKGKVGPREDVPANKTPEDNPMKNIEDFVKLGKQSIK